jgi:16S rRNA (cytidine1402-2'-O)-methyltransferase
MMEALLEELPIKKAAAICAKLTGLNKRDLYQWALEQK